ncbi:hypothetical protein ACXZ65_34465 [Streptomyces aculeolatus]
MLRCDAELLDGTECVAPTRWPSHVATHRELRRLRHPYGWRTRRAPDGGQLLAPCPDHTGRTRH